MPPIGERLTNVKVEPRITPEQQEVIKSLELKIGRRMNVIAPPIGHYMVYPLYYTDDLTLTVSGCATYDANGKTVAALVTRDCNDDVKLQTFLYEIASDDRSSLAEYMETVKKGPVVEVSSRQWNRGRLEYCVDEHRNSQLTSFEQYMDAFANIIETLDLIEIANLATYGVVDFEGLDEADLVAIRERAEPGLINFVQQSFQREMEYGRA